VSWVVAVLPTPGCPGCHAEGRGGVAAFMHALLGSSHFTFFFILLLCIYIHYELELGPRDDDGRPSLTHTRES